MFHASCLNKPHGPAGCGTRALFQLYLPARGLTTGAAVCLLSMMDCVVAQNKGFTFAFIFSNTDRTEIYFIFLRNDSC